MMGFNRKCIGFDIRLCETEGNLVSMDPNVLSRPVKCQSLLDDSIWVISNPLNLFINESSIDEFLLSEPEISKTVKLSFTCSPLMISALYEVFGIGWLEDLPSESELLERGWFFNGFDVVDLRGLISGINGCGRSKLRREINYLLNDNGLFFNFEEAVFFAESQSFCLPTHAPFIVVGIFSK